MTNDHASPRWVAAVASQGAIVETNDDALPRGRMFHLDARFESGGVWAGAAQLVESAFLDLLDRGLHDVLDAHNYELHMALPMHRNRIKLKRGSLTDTSNSSEKTRSFPLDRAYRIVHGLVGLILEWRDIQATSDRWSVIVRGFDDAQHLGARFFVELARRVSMRRSGIDVILETRAEPRQLGLSSKALPAWIGALPLEPLQRYQLDKTEAMKLRDTLVHSSNVEFIEENYPRLLAQYRRDQDDRSAAAIALKAMSVCNFFGYYHEAAAHMRVALPYMDAIVGDDQAQRWTYVAKLFTNLVCIGQPEEAMSAIETFGIPHFTRPELRAQSNYMLSMGYLRFAKPPNLNLAEKYILAAVADIDAAKEQIDPEDFYFHKVFIDNGLAFLRVRQGRAPEALELCQSGYTLLTRELGEDKHALHRSVLLYNAAQVYVMLEQLDIAIEYYNKAIAMDPHYSEYYNEAGNLQQRKEHFREALDLYDRALECSAPYPEVYFNKAVCHARLEEADEALNNLQISLELDPDQFDAYMLHAEILDMAGREEDALHDYDKAISLNEAAVEARVNRAVIHFNRGRFDLALHDMDRVISIDAGQADHYENRAEIHKAMHQDALYRRDLEAAEARRSSV